MTDHQPFLDAICASPGDDAPRLIFADWLEEHGECERAEFIRIQLELANHPRQVEWLRQMPIEQWSGCEVEGRLLKRLVIARRRERELFRLSGPAGWWGDLPGAYRSTGDDLRIETANGWSFGVRRGFVASIRCTLAQWCDRPCEYGYGPLPGRHENCTRCCGTGTTEGHAGEVSLHHPIESVTLTDRRPLASRTATQPGYAYWSTGATDGANAAFVHILPADLFRHLEGVVISNASGWVAYPTESDALTALDRAAARLGRKRAIKLQKETLICS